MLKKSSPALGARVRAAMRGAGISVPQIAAACEVSSAAVYGWIKTGRIAKYHLPTISALTKTSLAALLGEPDLVDVHPATKTQVLEVELPREAIELARSWLVLPENERNDFRRKIETAALRYRDHVPDAKMRTWGNERAPAGKKPPKSDPHSN